MHVQVSEQTSKSALKAIEKEIYSLLSDVRAAVEDWQQMLSNVDAAVEELALTPKTLEQAEVDEAVSFPEWARDNHFTFLGYREYKLVGRGSTAHLEIVPKTGRGILRDDKVLVFEGLRDAGNLTPEV